MSKKEEPANNQQAANQAAANVVQEPELLDFRNIKAGDYFIHVYIEETRGLVHPKDTESTVDPVIKVECCGRTKSTRVKDNKGTGMTYWGDHLFFEVKFEDSKELELQKMKISVIDHNLIGFDALIGDFELDLVSVYFAEKHVIEHRWVALSNLQKEYNVIKGFLKFSINVAGPGEDQVKLEDEKPQADNTLHRDDAGKGVVGPPQVLLPPQLQTKPFQMQIQLIRAENLVKMDGSFGTIDCYMVFQFAGSKYVTDIIKDNRNPTWGKLIMIPYYEPTISQTLIVKVYDWDRASSDDIVGSFSFNYNLIKNGKYKNLFWINIYGSQVESEGEYSVIMNSNPDLGTFWKGRVLLSLTCKEMENPKLGATGLDNKIMQDNRVSSPMDWKIIVELYYGLNFQDPNGKYSIMIRWADQEIVFDNGLKQPGLWEWFERKTLNIKFPYLSSEELPDVFVYLVIGGKKIAYLRKPAKYFQNMLMKDDAELFFLKPDKGEKREMRDDEAGMIKMRLTVGDSMVLSSPGKSWEAPLTKPFYRDGILYANLYYGQDLLPADSDGNSDPKVMISYYGRTAMSSTINDSLNPVWYERIKMKVPLFNLKDSPPLLVNVYDHDTFGDDFIGSVGIDLNAGLKEGYVAFNKKEVPEPQWFPIQYHKDHFSGRILISFNFYENEPTMLPSIFPDMEKFNCKIRIVGMRGLQSLGLLPVKRPYVKFDINSLRTRDEKQALREKGSISTEPKESGNNPNISTIISFSLNLPKDVNLCPSLSCTVYDYIMKGLSQPVLGVFSIDLKKFILKKRETMEKNLKQISKQLSEGLKVNNDVTGVTLVNLMQASKPHEHVKVSDGDKVSNIEIPTITKKPEENIPGYMPLQEVNLSNQDISIEVHKKQEQAKEAEVIDSEGRIHSHLVIVKPVYAYDPVTRQVIEKNIPDQKKYVALGWDPKQDRLNKPPKKHYRYIVDDELENSPFMDKNTFDEFTITRAQRNKKDSYFSVLLGKPFIPKDVGKFKCWVDIISESEELVNKANKATVLLPGLAQRRISENRVCDVSKKVSNQIDNEFLVKRDVMVRVYVISCVGLPPMDSGSLSDPYVQLRLGKNVVNNQKEYLKDKANADFFTMFELKTSLPGNCVLHLEVWDYDSLVNDDLIGETTIDLENRFFSKSWRSLDYYPIETRELRHPDSSASRGRVTMWCEIIDLTDKEAMHDVWDIKPKPSMDFELRTVVWDCEDVPNNDIEDASDLYVTGTLGDKTLKTDVHYRSQNGLGSFNWRMVWPITLPAADTSLTFQIWDKDFLSGNDFISDVSFSFAQQAIEAFENDCPVKIYSAPVGAIENIKDGVDNKLAGVASDLSGKPNAPADKKAARRDEKFILNLRNAKKAGYSTLKELGKMSLSFELVPGSIAKMNKVGQGRGEPNHDPWLPPPVGRFEWSWNPITLFNRCVGPKARWKICCAIWIIICCAILISLAPIIIGNAVGNILSK